MINGAHLAGAAVANAAFTAIVAVAAVRWLERRMRLEMDERVAALMADGHDCRREVTTTAVHVAVDTMRDERLRGRIDDLGGDAPGQEPV